MQNLYSLTGHVNLNNCINYNQFECNKKRKPNIDNIHKIKYFLTATPMVIKNRNSVSLCSVI